MSFQAVILGVEPDQNNTSIILAAVGFSQGVPGSPGSSGPPGKEGPAVSIFKFRLR